MRELIQHARVVDVTEWAYGGRFFARLILGGIEFMHMIVKGQMKDDGIAQTPAQQFYALIV
ncbi:hypothetical protein QF001_002847 [Paraburkholderia youngii]